MRLNKKVKSLFNYKEFHKDLYDRILLEEIRPRRRHFKAADALIRIVGEKQIEFYYSSFYRIIDLGIVIDKIIVDIDLKKDEEYHLCCEYWLDRPTYITFLIYYEAEYIANISGTVGSVRKYFRRAYNDLKKKIRDGKKPVKNTKVFYYLTRKGHCVCCDDNKFYDI